MHNSPTAAPNAGCSGGADDAPHGLGLPQTIHCYQPPRLPAVDDLTDLAAALEALNAVRLALFAYSVGGLPQVVDLLALDAANLRLVEETLGVGEVSMTITGKRPARIVETRFTGVWRIRESDADGHPRRDVLEVADVPGLVRFSAFAGARSVLDLPTVLPEGVMNAPGVLAELKSKVAARVRGNPNPSSINLTLLPLTEQDRAFLVAYLGSGAVQMRSRGYGDCDVSATGLRHCWWVRYSNVEGQEILTQLEVTDCPVAAAAAQEDIDDSAVRLHEVFESLRL